MSAQVFSIYKKHSQNAYGKGRFNNFFQFFKAVKSNGQLQDPATLTPEEYHSSIHSKRNCVIPRDIADCKEKRLITTALRNRSP